MQRLWVGLGALLGLGAVVMAAVRAHLVSDPKALFLVGNAVDMQVWHALALIGIGLWAPRGGRLADWAGAAMAVGIVLFCLGVYVHVLGGISLGPAAPVGGTLTMLGWLLLAVSAFRAR